MMNVWINPLMDCPPPRRSAEFGGPRGKKTRLNFSESDQRSIKPNRQIQKREALPQGGKSSENGKPNRSAQEGEPSSGLPSKYLHIASQISKRRARTIA